MRCLILIDIQNDFLPGGALSVPHGDEVVPVANSVMPKFDHIVATLDWHPRDHGSFAANHQGRQPGEVVDLNGLPQILWPVHCVQDTEGADFAPGLDTSRITKVFHKGMDPAVDSYSGFYDNGRIHSTGLGEYLRASGVSEIYIMGLATDYCVKFSVMDALSLGFRVFVIEDGCRGVDLSPGDSESAIAGMKKAGAIITSSQYV